ncbi:phosphohistidine phosphatase SixA [Bermanella marisrubri]|uniref:Hypothetical phosphohistidine phosphatase n=1 Tax=Bermanella marisrubri TaxID=207949 RepID=Q1N0N1_9GAMM|nr:phosphohistidine phosphatase SixA [Bermanella marisrubri]EAT11802.1 hypothetical phosphohistidine phosphatase [Oceanobacter sp. RED65] [Bermanella marisrubri]QIZ83837.1 phosphohistidine phosphatase SixA [Bermanella marisrubri]
MSQTSRLFILRHGQAANVAPSDAERPLTVHGEAQALQLAKQWQGFHFDYVFVSPYTRAQQTWQALSSQLTTDHIETVTWCTPDISTKKAIDTLVTLPNPCKALIVCHQTFAGRLVTQLTEGNEHGMHLNTANAVELEAEVFAKQCAHYKAIHAPSV